MAHSKVRIIKLLAYLLVPAIFGVLGYLLLYVGLKPVWSLASAAGSMLVAENAPNFEPGLSDIYNEDPMLDPSENGGGNQGAYVPGPSSTTRPGVDMPTAAPGETPDPNATEEPAPTPTHRPWKHHDGPIDVSEIVLPEIGMRYGHLYNTRIGLDAPVYYGDNNTILRYGVGQYRGSFTPGFGRVILLSGHNTTFFRCLKFIEVGDDIIFDTNYETYTYRVTNVTVMEADDLYRLLENTLFLQNHETLVMYTCYPFHAVVGQKHQRLVVFCERIEGADVIWRT